MQNYLLVYRPEAIDGVLEADAAALCVAAGGRLLKWHAAIGTALCESANSGFVPDVIRLVRRSWLC